MQHNLPGQPQAGLSVVDHTYHEGQLIVAYISGASLVLSNGPETVLQVLQPVSAGPELVAVKLQQTTSRLAFASLKEVFVYGLREEIKGTLRWTSELLIRVGEDNGSVRTLSWGSDDELLVSTTNTLAVYSTQLPSTPPTPVASSAEDETLLPTWTKGLSSPLSYTELSPSASLIATVSQYDTLVKIWRRLSFESPQFDYAYLRHPAPITHAEWRRTLDGNGSREDDVLFTICADGILRVWKSTNPHGVEILSLFAEVDLVIAIKPRDPGRDAASKIRYAFVIDAKTVEDMAKEDNGDQSKANGQARHAHEHFAEIASRQPDIVVIADEHGHMSAWGIESVGCKRRSIGAVSKPVPFHINLTENVHLAFRSGLRAQHCNARLFAMRAPSAPGEVAILAHHFDGRITWHQSLLRDLLDPSAKKQQMRHVATWTGHTTAIKKVIRTASGKSLISRTAENEGILWRQTRDRKLVRRSTVNLHQHIHRVVLLRDGEFLVCLHHDKVTLWDCRQFYATEVASLPYNLTTKPLCLLVLPEIDPATDFVHLATVATDMTGLVWEVRLPQSSDKSDAGSKHESKISMAEYCTFKLDDMDEALYVLPVDPAGSAAVASDFLDIFAHDVAMSYSAKGTLRTYTARVDTSKRTVDFLTTSTVDTGLMDPSMGSATSIRRAALVDSSRLRLTIWDTRSGRLDYEETFTTPIQDLDWASTPDGQSILSVGFAHRVHVYSQLRYDYVSERPAWARVKDVEVPSWNPSPIGDSVWLGSGCLVVGAGNMLHVAPETVDPARDLAPELRSAVPHKKSEDLYQLVRRMNGPLAVFHPQFIAQCVLAGKLDVVHRVLLRLLETLKFYTEGEELHALLSFAVEDFVSSEEDESTYSTTQNGMRSYTDDSSSTVTDAVAQSLNELLAQKSIPQLTSSEQISLASIIECVATVSTHSRSIDLNASRYLLSWRAALLRSHQGSQQASSMESGISWREVVFAYHSTSQDILCSLIQSTSNNTLSWTLARQSKLFTWLTSRETLLAQFENLAKAAYTATDPRDPVACSLYYLALRKKQVLVGLWRMATWSREQAATMKMLRNDFNDPRWKTAAKKNAFALMGKRRFEYAAAFFLLADDLRSALGVIGNQLGDVDLALAVGRVYGDDGCDEVRELVRERVIRVAISKGDRWMATWGFWFLGERGAAVRALVSPLDRLLSSLGDDFDAAESNTSSATEGSQSLAAKSFLNDDPALIILYQQLRAKSIQTLRGAMQVNPVEEWRFIIRTAGLLRRMGCDVLALDLVRNWEFLRTETRAVKEENEESIAELPPSPSASRAGFDPRKLLRRRSSLVVDDLGPRLHHGSAQAEAQIKVPSLLDGYGEQPKPRSMLDDFDFNEKPAVPAATKQPRSLLDAYDEPEKEQAPLTTVPSMLDDYAMPSEKPKTRSMLDDFGFDEKASTSSTRKPARSLLDAYEEPKKAETPAKVPSMLDDYDTSEQPKATVKSMLDDFESPSDVGEKNGTDDGKEKKAKKDKKKEEKKQPTTFKEPNADSILDSFGF